MEATSKTDRHRLQIIGAFAAIYLIWGSTYVAVRFAIESMPPFLMGAVRFSTAGILIYALTRLRGASRPEKCHLLPTAIIGLLMLVFGSMGVVLAERTVSSGLVSLLVASVPVYIVLIEWFKPGGSAPTIRVLIGLALGFAGLILLVGLDQAGLNHNSVDLWGVTMVLIGAIGSAVGALYARSANLPSSQQLAAGMEMVFAGLFLFIASFFAGEFTYFQHFSMTLKTALSLVYLIIFGSMVAFSAYVWLLRVVNPSLVSTYAYVNPVVAVFLGWLMAGEVISVTTLIGASLLLTAVWLITQSRPKVKIVDSVNTDELQLTPAPELCAMEPKC